VIPNFPRQRTFSSAVKMQCFVYVRRILGRRKYTILGLKWKIYVWVSKKQYAQRRALPQGGAAVRNEAEEGGAHDHRHDPQPRRHQDAARPPAQAQHGDGFTGLTGRVGSRDPHERTCLPPTSLSRSNRSIHGACAPKKVLDVFSHP